MNIGDVVEIKENDSHLDCCQGKRGRIVHVAVGGGWLIHTDHFCPRPREDGELTVVSQETLATELLEGLAAWIRESYEEAREDMLIAHAKQGDLRAKAVLILRGHTKYKL